MMGNISREMEMLRKNQKEMLGIQNTVSEIKNTFVGLLVDYTWNLLVLGSQEKTLKLKGQ